MQMRQVKNETEVAEQVTTRAIFSDRGSGPLAEAQFAVRMLEERLPPEMRQGRLRVPLAGAGEIISSLRKTFQQFIAAQIDTTKTGGAAAPGFGFGHSGFVEVNAEKLVDSSHKALEALSELYEMLSDSSPSTLPQRDVIVEVQALLQRFLFDFQEFAPEGRLDRSSLPDAVRYCIATARDLGKLSIGCEAIKLQMLAAGAG